MTDKVPISEKKKITKHDFYFEIPLYEAIKVKELDGIFSGEVDAYSAKNGIDTTYKISYAKVNGPYDSDFNDFYKIALTCKRKENDVLRFLIHVADGIVTKVGQSPSLADVQFAELGKKYDRQLERQDLQEFKKAIGLAAHGVGAGSIVYLRRIFENLIFKAFSENKSEVGLDEKEFRLKRMDEKIELLRSYLPPQLIEMKSIYSILSLGVHELSEQQCLKYFPALKLSIELILEAQIKKDEEDKRNKEVKQAIMNISQDLSKK